jgi:hypothetical protein
MPDVKDITKAFQELQDSSVRGEAHLVAASNEVLEALTQISEKKSAYEIAKQRCKECIPQHFYLGQEVLTPDGKGLVVKLFINHPTNGLYIRPELSMALVWYSCEGAANGWSQREYSLDELKEVTE